MLKKNTRDQRYDTTVQGEDLEASQPEAYYPTPDATRSRGAADQPEGRTANARTQSLVDAHSTFDGKYETEQDLCIEGTISGEVICRGEIIIERDATVQARIEARDATVRGRVDGEVTCAGRLLLTSTAVVTGTLKAGTLVVEEGATLRGSVETVQGNPVPMNSRGSRSQEATSSKRTAETEAETPAPSSGGRNGSRTREVPSFALVSTDDRAATERN